MTVQTTTEKMDFLPGFSEWRAAEAKERARMDALAREQYLAELEAKAFAKGFAVGYAEGFAIG